MAGDWLKFEKATPDKPEVFAIAAKLDMDPDAVVGKLIRVWSWFDTHTTDGNGLGVTRPLLDRIAGVTGFVAAMESVTWVVVSAAGVSLPNFERHTGETSKGRALGAKRAAEHRAKSNASGVTKSVTPALPREEKRREEDKEQKQELSAQPAASRFGEWWSAWPTQKRVARKKAEQLWGRRKLDLIADRLVADVLHRVAHDDGWQRGYAPDPCTYINQDRWEDALRPAPTATVPTAPASKTLNAIQALEGMKHGLAQNRISDRVPEAALLEFGPDSGD